MHVGPGDHEIPWAMQLVVRVEKREPASEIDTAEAAARAVVLLLDDPRARPVEGRRSTTDDGGEVERAAGEDAPGVWAHAVDHWRDGRIRKLVRRARGVRWSDAQALPGVTVEQNGAGARALPPGPVQPLPPQLAKLQVEGTNLPDTGPSTTEDALVRIGVSPLVEMTSGKLCAQCGHAAQLAYEQMPEELRDRWRADAFRVRVERPDADTWASSPGRVSVVDAGFTELDGPTETTRAWF